MAEDQGYQLKVVWPDDVYADADLANHFVFTDDGQGLYLAFAHVAPLPSIPEGGVTEIAPRVRGSVYLSHANALTLANLLQQYVKAKQGQGDSQG